MKMHRKKNHVKNITEHLVLTMPKSFDEIVQDIHNNTLILKARAVVLDFYIQVIDGKCVTGIYHKVNYFNLEVFKDPLLDTNDSSALGYKTFHS